MRSVRRDVETGLQTGVETVVKYIQTVQTIKLRILIENTLSRSLYGLYVIHSSLYPGLYPGLYPVSTSETIGAGQHRMFSRRSSKPRHFARRSGSRTWRSSWIGAAVVSSTTWSSRRPSSAWACLPASERQWALRRGRLSSQIISSMQSEPEATSAGSPRNMFITQPKPHTRDGG